MLSSRIMEKGTTFPIICRSSIVSNADDDDFIIPLNTVPGIIAQNPEYMTYVCYICLSFLYVYSHHEYESIGGNACVSGYVCIFYSKTNTIEPQILSFVELNGIHRSQTTHTHTHPHTCIFIYLYTNVKVCSSQTFSIGT